MELQEQHQANVSDLKDQHSSSLNHWHHEMNQQFKTLKDEVSGDLLHNIKHSAMNLCRSPEAKAKSVLYKQI